MILLNDFAHLIQDSGPLYHEFVPNGWIKEPWNALSSLFFFVPVIFWAIKLNGQYFKHAIITALLPLLFINGLGSTLFHAFRASDLFLFLDFMPAMAMSFILSLFMWWLVTGKKWKSGLVVLGFYGMAVLAIILIRPYMSEDRLPNVGYFFSGSCFLFPFLIMLKRTRFFKWELVMTTFLLLIAALVFRTLDYPTPNPFPDSMPQGTHFLWHITSSIAVFTLGFYLFSLREKNPAFFNSRK